MAPIDSSSSCYCNTTIISRKVYLKKGNRIGNRIIGMQIYKRF